MLFNRTANRGTPTKDNPVPSVKFCGTRYYKFLKSRYYVSKSGEILSLKQKLPRILRQYEVNSGYMCTDLWSRNKPKKLSVHRIVARVFLGKCPKGYEVDHIDGDKKNNHVSNLRYIPMQENRGSPNTGGNQHDAVKVKSKVDGVIKIFDCIKQFREFYNIPKWQMDYVLRGRSYFAMNSPYTIKKFVKGATTIKIVLVSKYRE